MEIYNDGCGVIKVNTKENYAIYEDIYNGYCKMSIKVAHYIAKKMKEDIRVGYNLIDLEIKRWNYYCNVIAKEKL